MVVLLPNTLNMGGIAGYSCHREWKPRENIILEGQR